MAKDIPIIFASSGDITDIPNDTQPSGSVSYTEGWGSQYEEDPASGGRRLEKNNFNGIFNLITTNQKELVDQGVINHIADKEYLVNARVRGTDGNNYISNKTTVTAPPSADWDIEGAVDLDGVLSTDNLLHMQDQKPNGTNAGTFTNGAYDTRDLNTILTNNIAGASLSSNSITLPAGVYQIYGSAPAHFVATHQARFFNITDNTEEILGTSERSPTNAGTTTRSIVDDIITVAGTKVFQLQHRCETARSADGRGIATTFPSSHEVYSFIKIYKVG